MVSCRPVLAMSVGPQMQGGGDNLPGGGDNPPGAELGDRREGDGTTTLTRGDVKGGRRRDRDAAGKRDPRELLREGYQSLKRGNPEEAVSLARGARALMRDSDQSGADELEDLAQRVAALYENGAKALDDAKLAFIRKTLESARRQCESSVAFYQRAASEGGMDLGKPSRDFLERINAEMAEQRRALQEADQRRLLSRGKIEEVVSTAKTKAAAAAATARAGVGAAQQQFNSLSAEERERIEEEAQRLAYEELESGNRVMYHSSFFFARESTAEGFEVTPTHPPSLLPSIHSSIPACLPPSICPSLPTSLPPSLSLSETSVCVSHRARVCMCHVTWLSLHAWPHRLEHGYSSDTTARSHWNCALPSCSLRYRRTTTPIWSWNLLRRAVWLSCSGCPGSVGCTQTRRVSRASCGRFRPWMVLFGTTTRSYRSSLRRV